MAEEFSRPNSEAKFHDLSQFILWAETPNRKGFRSSLRFGERNGAPRISVSTNAESGPKMLPVGMSPTVWEQFLDLWKDIIQGPPGTKNKIVNMQKDPSFTEKVANFDDVPKVPKNVLHFGKDNEGICWLCVEQKDAERIVFKIIPSSWHIFYKPDGTVATAEELSSRYAMNLLTSVKAAMERWTGRMNPPWDPEASKQKRTAAGGMYTPDFGDTLDL